MCTVEKWGVFEVAASGHSDKNPFVDYDIKGTFSGKEETVTVDGFYDGDGIYRVRFMPSFEGKYTYELSGSFSDEIVTGEFTVTAATEGNHGPVHVANTYHFAYGDGTPYYSVGTTCYVWTHMPDDVCERTLEELSKGYFNKIRFMLWPKHYLYNLRNPVTFPYEGTPVDSSDLTPENFEYHPDFSGNDLDFKRFNPAHFRRIEKYIVELMKLGIEADLIVMHPYDRWGFSDMSKEENELHWKYVIARFAAYRNVWWSLSNEYDLFKNKTFADWERYAEIICEKDPYTRLRSIHNCAPFYDFTRPWVTHCSLQRQDLYRTTEYTDELRIRYKKPVVWDEIAYEGNLDQGWGNISAQEIVRRFWEASLRGGYAGHSETYERPDDILWWSHGGNLYGESPERINFLHSVLCETPGLGLKKIDGSFDETVAVADSYVIDPEAYEIHYYGFCRPSFRIFEKSEQNKYQVEIIDTWEMTIKDAGIHSGKFKIKLPGKEYMAIRLKKI